MDVTSQHWDFYLFLNLENISVFVWISGCSQSLATWVTSEIISSCPPGHLSPVVTMASPDIVFTATITNSELLYCSSQELGRQCLCPPVSLADEPQCIQDIFNFSLNQ